MGLRCFETGSDILAGGGGVGPEVGGGDTAVTIARNDVAKYCTATHS